MLLVSGTVLIGLAVALFVYSLPRNGRPARFVGSAWEPYIVILIVGGLGLGMLIAIKGAI
jgi:hypothetical protein